MSRSVAIYCRGKAVRANRTAVEALRDVASREGWTVTGTFVDGAGLSAHPTTSTTILISLYQMQTSKQSRRSLEGCWQHSPT